MKPERDKENIVKKPVRTISGVTPLAVVLKPKKCNHGTCIYCPGGESVPQSYTNKSPAIMRALALQFDPYAQVKNRLYVLDKMGHPTDKIELIILGGTFSQYPRDYQYDFVKRCYDALNSRDSPDLETAKKINETAEHRCVAMCIETRPDGCSPEEIQGMLNFGTTRVEIGVQMPDDELYKKINRGHKVGDVIEATKNLKNAGFKLGYHIMPGLPYSNPKKDIALFKKIFNDEKFRPDQLKIYPCQIIEDSPLAKTHGIIGFKPYDEEQTRGILTEMMRLVPEYCRIMRMMREFPREKLIGGVEKLDLRKDIEYDFRKSKEKIKEIRMREIGFNKNENSGMKLKIIEYDASDGREFFLEFVNEEDVLFGLLRLRLFNDSGTDEDNDNKIALRLKRGDIKNSREVNNKKRGDNFPVNLKSNLQKRGDIKFSKAIVRELHVYGHSVKIGQKEEHASQHTGLGKALLDKAEEITREHRIKELSIISGIGVREYYKKLGYELRGFYMVKGME
ncbi:MAG: tRNA uridine(34) 5-carboxymethylaminomethyl modification radical SAM/GNAT enzyme Elp3 [Candidatus Nanoarchaeia archaeon]|nr:tRNA uridine(34) 5-carboxymethylaminomethyl modification radical SAM/GNAT enzyme Elp3 [Candidatus Nanoarchaeia archaeon]